ncbi:MarR family transcriptional regulator [Mycobacterium sp. CBMA271]|uniref:MarR family winged helix-turn-helix transcriptional regulator n=1 Tax=unclassified Mycobacteroides TaxID=2618759 RepID=UPI0012DF8AAA|nr:MULTISPECIES: MarR family transcriptional regulator [unclassified Mycobacteroides]MUM18101.1 transcriptional regulator [Mycobacteroides sp. CBMA 326]MUM23414.1 MarR family transcriptional regulator [Mycobacteroides sp. CBMA 271]
MSDEEWQPLGALMYRVSVALRSEIAATLAPLNLPFPQYICMRVLSVNPGWSNADLARATDVTPQSMNTVLQALEDAGLVARPDTVASGRARPAQLSRSGAALLKQADALAREAEERLLSGISERQRSDFFATLRDIAGEDASTC